jgi:parvulin-like peptidyl-prolyl isomerase
MNTYLKVFLPILIMIAIAGCTGGQKPAIEVDLSADSDSLQAFIFVESSIVNIDSDMMAQQLGTGQYPAKIPTIDSASAQQAAYEILLDSIFGQDAESFDLENEQPALYHQYLKLRHERVMRQMYQELVVDSVTVSDSAVKAMYEEMKESLLVPDRYRARHIVIDGDGLRVSEDSLEYAAFSGTELDSLARTKVIEIRERILNGENFDTLAILYSQDANTAPRGGDLGYFELVSMVSPFDSTVEHTPVGSVSGVIRTQYGWHVVKVEDFAEAHHAPLDSVYAPIENKLKEQGVMDRSRNFVDSLRELAVIVYDTAAIMMDDSLHRDDDTLATVNPEDREFGNDIISYRDYRENVFAYKKRLGLDVELTFEQKVDLISGISVRKLLLQSSRKLGYYNNPEIVEWSEAKLKSYGVSTMKKEFMVETYKPTEEELRAYYESHIDDYVRERPFTVQHIVFADSNLAEHVRDLLMSGYDFMEMVDEYYPGDPDIKRSAADLGEIGPDDMPTEFYSAAKRTPVGEISRPVKTEYGYHLIKVIKKDHSIAFDRARINIESILKKEYRDNRLKTYVDSRLGQPPIINWELLDQLYYRPRLKPNFSNFRSTP